MQRAAQQAACLGWVGGSSCKLTQTQCLQPLVALCCQPRDSCSLAKGRPIGGCRPTTQESTPSTRPATTMSAPAQRVKDDPRSVAQRAQEGIKQNAELVAAKGAAAALHLNSSCLGPLVIDHPVLHASGRRTELMGLKALPHRWPHCQSHRRPWQRQGCPGPG